MSDDPGTLMLRAYNSEADNSIRSRKLGKAVTARKRLNVTRDAVAKLGGLMEMRISGEFNDLRVEACRASAVAPIIRGLAGASLAAVVNGRQLETDLTAIRAGWERGASARAGSAGSRLLDVLQRYPIVDAKFAADALGISARNAQGGIDRLAEDGILHKIGSADRNRSYEAWEVLIARDEFAARANARGPLPHPTG
jgi:hypothetical protein